MYNFMSRTLALRLGTDVPDALLTVVSGALRLPFTPLPSYREPALPHGAVPAVGELWRWGADGQRRALVVLGNRVRDDGTIWMADVADGAMLRLPAVELRPATDLPAQSLLETVRRARGWTRAKVAADAADAMWWLGDVYERGATTVEPNGRAALAFYLAAIRRDPACYGRNLARIAEDGARLFRPLCLPPPDEEFRAAARAFSERFPEMRPGAAPARIEVRRWRQARDLALAISAF